MYVDVIWKHCSNGLNGQKEKLHIVLVLVHGVHESRHIHNAFILSSDIHNVQTLPDSQIGGSLMVAMHQANLLYIF